MKTVSKNEMNYFIYFISVSKKITHIESFISTAISFDSKFIGVRLFQFLPCIILRKHALKQEEYYYKFLKKLNCLTIRQIYCDKIGLYIIVIVMLICILEEEEF